MFLIDKLLDYSNLFVLETLYTSQNTNLKSGFDKRCNGNDVLELLEKDEGNVHSFIRNLPKMRKERKYIANYFQDFPKIPSPKNVINKRKYLFAFDDIMTNSNQSKDAEFYTSTRNKNMSFIYIS